VGGDPPRDSLGLRLIVRACACCGHDGHVNSFRVPTKGRQRHRAHKWCSSFFCGDACHSTTLTSPAGWFSVRTLVVGSRVDDENV
jgi:hypothetical protein